MTQSRFLEAPLVWQADGELKNSVTNVNRVVGRWSIMDKNVNVVYERPPMLPGKQAAAQKYLCKCILPIFSRFFFFSFS